MKAITICQPYAELIARGVKRVENRSWRSHYRGPLAIHAGLSRLHLGRIKNENGLDFGAIIAVAELVDCLHIGAIQSTLDATLWGDEHKLPAELEWLTTHPHASGPWCWVLANVRRLDTPIPCGGQLSLWDAPAAVAELI